MSHAEHISGDLILSSEAARILGVSAQSIRHWDRTGRLRAVAKTVSGLRLFTKDQVEELRRSLEAQRRPTEAVPAA